MGLVNAPARLKGQSASSDVRPLPEMSQLAESDPTKDFDDAKRRNDIYFVALRGIGLMVPYVGDSYKQYGIEARVVPGTSDVLSREELELKKRVIVYAEKYNELVLAFLAEKQKHSEKTGK